MAATSPRVPEPEIVTEEVLIFTDDDSDIDEMASAPPSKAAKKSSAKKPAAKKAVAKKPARKVRSRKHRRKKLR